MDFRFTLLVECCLQRIDNVRVGTGMCVKFNGPRSKRAQIGSARHSARESGTKFDTTCRVLHMHTVRSKLGPLKWYCSSRSASLELLKLFDDHSVNVRLST